MNKLKSIHKY